MNISKRKMMQLTLIAIAIIIVAVAVIEMATKTPREEFEARLSDVETLGSSQILGALKEEVEETFAERGIQYEDYYIAAAFVAGTPKAEVVVLTTDDCQSYMLDADDSFIVNIIREDMVDESAVVEAIKAATYNLEGDKIIVS